MDRCPGDELTARSPREAIVIDLKESHGARTTLAEVPAISALLRAARNDWCWRTLAELTESPYLRPGARRRHPPPHRLSLARLLARRLYAEIERTVNYARIAADNNDDG